MKLPAEDGNIPSLDMTIDQLQILISTDETRTLELKKTTGELKEGMHSACAFLNTDGGWLIFGVAPGTLTILGQEVTDSTRREIAQALTGIEPAIDVPVEYIDVPDRPAVSRAYLSQSIN